MKHIGKQPLGIDQGEDILFSDFEDEGEMWTGEGDRERRLRVTFSEPFRAAPVVHVALSMWDMDASTNARVQIGAEAVRPDSFEAVFRTWGDTRVARARITWIAIGPVRDDEDWELY